MTIGREGPMPDTAIAAMVAGPRGWPVERIDALRQHADAGAVVVVCDPPEEAAWDDLLGVDRGPQVRRSEIVLHPGSHVAARHLPTTVVHGDVRTLLPREGTQAVLTTRVHLSEQAALTARPIGSGVIVGVGCLPEAMDADGIFDLVINRLARRVTHPTSDVGIGILGYGQHGGMGWVHGTGAQAVPGLHLAGIAEPHPQRRADAAARFADATIHDSLDGLLGDDAVDAIIVATPPSTHHDLARTIMRAGRHVIVEKPLCFTAAEADELLAVAAETDRMLTVHQNRRWDADFRAIQRLIASGQIGEVFNVETFVGGFEHPCQMWHSDRGVSGGRLYDWGAHLIDQTLLLHGGDRPTSVTAIGHKRVWHDVTNLDQVRVRLTFGDGREAEFLDSDILAVRRPKYLIQGTAGTIVGHYSPVVHEQVTADRGYQLTEHHHAEGPARLRMSVHQPGWGLHTVDVPGLPAAPYGFLRGVADHLQLGDPVPVDPASVRQVTAVLEAANTSAHDGGRPVIPG